MLITVKKAYAFEDFRYIEIATKELNGVYEVVEPKGKRAEWLGNILKDENVMIILCGSSMSFIEKELLAEKNIEQHKHGCEHR